MSYSCKEIDRSGSKKTAFFYKISKYSSVVLRPTETTRTFLANAFDGVSSVANSVSGNTNKS